GPRVGERHLRVGGEPGPGGLLRGRRVEGHPRDALAGRRRRAAPPTRIAAGDDRRGRLAGLREPERVLVVVAVAHDGPENEDAAQPPPPEPSAVHGPPSNWSPRRRTPCRPPRHWNSAMKLADASTIRSRVRCTGCRLYRQMDWTISSKSRQSDARGDRPRV